MYDHRGIQRRKEGLERVGKFGYVKQTNNITVCCMIGNYWSTDFGKWSHCYGQVVVVAMMRQKLGLTTTKVV